MTNGFVPLLRRFFLLFLLLLAVSAVPSVAAAQSAEELFVQAQEAFDAKQYTNALERFRKAFAASGSPNARIYVARCLAKLRRNAEAYDEMQATVRDATKLAQSEERYAETRDAAARELALLEPKVGKIVIALTDENANAEVELNGTRVERDRIGVPLPVEPGTVVIEATLTGTDSQRREVEIAAGTTKTVTLTFGAAKADVTTDDDEEEDDGPSATVSVLQGIGIGIAVLGVGGLVAFAVTGSAARDKFGQLEDECGGARCSSGAKYEEIIDDGKKMETAANVTAVVGGVLLAAGLAMVIFGGDDDQEERQEVVGTAVPLEGGGMLQLRGSF